MTNVIYSSRYKFEEKLINFLIYAKIILPTL